MRAKRGLAARWAAAVAVGVLIVALFGGNAAAWLAPGTLSAPHTQIGSCSECHQSFDGGPSGWVHAAFGGTPGASEGDSQLCLSCHEAGEKPLRPHGVSRARLAGNDGAGARPEDADFRPVDLELAGTLAASPGDADGDLACASCHAEHEGREADITAMGDGRCQACHAQKFESLGAGHPEFGGYPHERRTRINFDHVRHAERHFAEAEADTAPQRCVACHEPGDRGKAMVVRGFEAGCADCHGGDVRGEKAAGSLGIPVITVPGLDLPSLRQADAQIGQWPAVSDRELTPFMRTMFAADPTLSKALERFRRLDPLDLRDATQADIDAVERIAWATKRLIRDLVVDGPAALRSRLAKALERRVDHGRARDLLGGMALETVQRARREWFPDLATELARHRAGEPVPMPGKADGAGQSPEPDQAATGSESLTGAGTAGDGDGGAESGESILAGGSGNPGSGQGARADEGDDAQSNETILGDDGAGSGSSEPILGEGDGESGADESILGDSGSGSDDGESILGGDDSDTGGDLLTGEGDESDDATASAGETDAQLPDPQPAEWGRLGSWYRDYYALLYRPGGHADRFLTGWLDLAGRAMSGDTGGGPAAILERLAASNAPGKCTKCHSVDATGNGGARINWAGRTPNPDRQAYTRFGHEPHFTLLADDQGCATCHAFDREADYAASFDDRDPHTYQSNFMPIERATCAECHNDRQAGNDCTQCHSYHVGRVTSRATRTRIDRMDKAAESR